MTDYLLGVVEVPVSAAAPSIEPAVRFENADDAATATTDGAAAQRELPPSSEPFVEHTPERKLQILDELDRAQVRGCTKCELHKGRTQTVFGDGDTNADLMFIGEGPGQNEDEQGKPFVGRAGELLNKMIVAMGFERPDVYIANVVKCRPPNNRTPTPAEIDTCWDYLATQIEVICPKVIVTLGGPAMKMLLNTKKGITAMRGTWHSYDGLVAHGGPKIPLMPTFHPAYLLRAYTEDNRRKVWSDLQAAMEVLGKT